MQNKNIASYFPTWKASAGAIFTAMESIEGIPWKDYIDGNVLDKIYIGVRSGLKFPTQLVKAFSEDGVADASTLASIITPYYLKNWIRLWETFVLEYSPVKNFSLEETETRNGNSNFTDTTNLTTTRTGSNSGTSAETKNLTDTRTGTIGDSSTETKNLKDKETKNLIDDVQNTSTKDITVTTDFDETTDHSRAGFNTSTLVNTEEAVVDRDVSEVTDEDDTINETTTHTGTDEIEHTGTDQVQSTKTFNTTDSHTGTDGFSTSETINESDAKTGTVGRVASDSEAIHSVKTGNMGYQSYQSLIKQEFELWKWNYFAHVFSDVDKILTLSVFDPCQIL